VKTFKVGVFEFQRKRRVGLTAYTTWFSTAWNGCCLHQVDAINGTEAKRLAMTQHRAKCMKGVAA
jgi:hypothetical protein